MKHFHKLTAALLMASAGMATSAAYAQEATAEAAPAVTVKVGDTIYDSEGALVGDVSEVNGNTAIIAVGEKKVGLPLNAFGKNDKGIIIGSTVAQLKASLAEQEAAATAALASAIVADAEVRSVNGSEVLGKVKSTEGDNVILTTEKGDVTLPKRAFFLPEHGLSVAFTAEQFQQALSQNGAQPTG